MPQYMLQISPTRCQIPYTKYPILPIHLLSKLGMRNLINSYHISSYKVYIFHRRLKLKRHKRCKSASICQGCHHCQKKDVVSDTKKTLCLNKGGSKCMMSTYNQQTITGQKLYQQTLKWKGCYMTMTSGCQITFQIIDCCW